jgi:hypothetical protein
VSNSQDSLRQRYRSAVMVRYGLLAGVVVALGLAAAALSAVMVAPSNAAETVAILERTFGLVSGFSALAAVVLVPLMMPTNAPHSATHCARQSASPGALSVAGCLFSRAIISGGMASVPAILGFVLFVSGADVTAYLAFVALTIVCSALTFPRWAVWQATVVAAEMDTPGA